MFREDDQPTPSQIKEVLEKMRARKGANTRVYNFLIASFSLPTEGGPRVEVVVLANGKFNQRDSKKGGWMPQYNFSSSTITLTKAMVEALMSIGQVRSPSEQGVLLC